MPLREETMKTKSIHYYDNFISTLPHQGIAIASHMTTESAAPKSLAMVVVHAVVPLLRQHLHMAGLS